MKSIFLVRFQMEIGLVIDLNFATGDGEENKRELDKNLNMKGNFISLLLETDPAIKWWSLDKEFINKLIYTMTDERAAD